jgi:hypothetical protein
MCCSEHGVLNVPPPVIEMLARYRQLQRMQGHGWGEDALPDMFTWARFSLLGAAFDEFAARGDWAQAVRAAVGEGKPEPGIIVVRLDGDGGFHVDRSEVLRGLPGTPVGVDVVVLADPESDGSIDIDGVRLAVAAGQAGLRTLDLDPAAGAVVLAAGGERREVRCVQAAAAGRLALWAPQCSRWSVVDEWGRGWFPDGVPAKWDVNHEPYFHAGEIEFELPVGVWQVAAARGIEFERQTLTVWVVAGEKASVRWEPVRRFDPSASGWYSADLHVHLNYSGDHVLDLDDAHRMQVGEDLNLVMLQAGNMSGPLVYDRELLESTAGGSLWQAHDHTALAGHEFRNGLLGHLHGMGLRGVPDPPFTGDEGTEHPHDWPPNAAACAQMQGLGGTVTYAHPAFSALDDIEDLFSPVRTVEARELVADAALGNVDTMEVVSCFDDAGAVVLWHHLLNCGLRLTATAGTDVFLSFAHGPGVASNPPGWGRMYAHLDGAPLSIETYREAITRGRTVVTNGPWLTLDVDGSGPGDVLDLTPGQRLRARATVIGSGVRRLVLHSSQGEVASTQDAVLEHELEVDAPSWVAAAAYGDHDQHTLGAPVFAHTTPVYLDVGGRRVAKPDSIRWCLRALDLLEQLVRQHGRFDPERRDDQLGDLITVVERARDYYRTIARGHHTEEEQCM